MNPARNRRADASAGKPQTPLRYRRRACFMPKYSRTPLIRAQLLEHTLIQINESQSRVAPYEAMRKDIDLTRSGVFCHLTILVAAFTAIGLVGCNANSLATPPGAIVGRGGGLYNYSPSVIQDGDLQKLWWCGTAQNPTDHEQTSDAILYESINDVTHAVDGPYVVLAETKGSWDFAFTCNPRVIGGTFVNPLGDGQTYKYEMFYVGTTSGVNNNIGAAFSNDGMAWKKYPDPVVLSAATGDYGIGQPAAYNADGKSSITLFYEDNTPTIHHVEAASPDGIHFTVKGDLTMNGIDPLNQNPTWGDMGYDSATGYWYAAFNIPGRASSTTAGIVEIGQRGFQLYRIPNSSLLTGTTPWEMVKTVDSNLTGYEVNFIPSLLHDLNGNINTGSYPKLELFVSSSLPYTPWDATPERAGNAGDVSHWAITVNSYDPSQSTIALQRYINHKTYEVTTGWIDPKGTFFPDVTLGHLYPAPRNGATVALYNCKEASTGYFTSVDPACEGQRVEGLDGYGYIQQPDGVSTVGLYACLSAKSGRFLSKDPACEGSGNGALLAYALP